MDRSFFRLSFLRTKHLALRAALAALPALVSLLSSPSLSQAAYDDDDSQLLGFDAIVNQLNREADHSSSSALRMKAASLRPTDPFDLIWIHGGIGLVNTMQTLSRSDGSQLYFNHKGFQASLGIDLLSENWMAEGTTRSFGDVESSGIHASLKEFELKILYKNRLSRQLSLRIGGGLSARYLSLKKLGEQTDFTTPSSVGTVGFDLFMNDRLSVGADLCARNTMIAETLDQNSYDATLRIDTHF